MPDKDHIKSIEKCFVILDCLHARRRLLTLEEITRITGYKKTTCFRLLKTLRTLGLVELSPATKKYRYGPRMAALGLSALKNMNLRNAALPILQQLRDEKRTVILITHKTNILSMMDKILVLNQGRVQGFGERDEIFAKLLAPRVAAVNNPATHGASPSVATR